MLFRVVNEKAMYDYIEACRITQGLDPRKEVLKIPAPKDEVEFWIKQIAANHSTLRSIKFRMVADAPKSVVMQVIRATKGHPQPEVQSSRPDWNDGKERSSDPYEQKLFMQDHTAESFVEMAKQRLCWRTESKTRDFMREAVDTLKKSCDPFLVAVGYCCKPYCEWYGFCPELKGCNYKPKLSEKLISEYRKDKEKA